ncbi:MAG: DUF4398 domain-containing protein [Candidatus Competibacteraceae bacterium]|nr:MAG: DUF4398 domain-containing protein [Candidatus Competibacteraceae bacterium]
MRSYRCLLRTLITKFLLLPVAILVLAACATAPVQEMSDARQAIHSAEAAGAVQHSPDHLQSAQRLLREAQTYLESGAYDDARRNALDARDAAIKAREKATQNAVLRSVSP